MQYDASSNLTFDGGQTFTYDVTGQQAAASYGGYIAPDDLLRGVR